MKSRADSVADWFIERSTRTALPVIIMGMAAYNFVEAAMHPTVTMKAAPAVTAPLHGTVESVGVKLADPSLLDRFIASLPDLLNLVLVLLGYSWMMWQKRTHGYDKKKAKRAVFLFGMGGVLVMLAPLLIITPAIAFYFDIRLPESPFGTSAMFVTAAFAMLLTGAVGNHVEWMKEHDRAKKLDAELENVV